MSTQQKKTPAKKKPVAKKKPSVKKKPAAKKAPAKKKVKYPGRIEKMDGTIGVKKGHVLDDLSAALGNPLPRGRASGTGKGFKVRPGAPSSIAGELLRQTGSKKVLDSERQAYKAKTGKKRTPAKKKKAGKGKKRK